MSSRQNDEIQYWEGTEYLQPPLGATSIWLFVIFVCDVYG